MRLFSLMICFVLILTNTAPVSAAGFSRVGTYGFNWEGVFAGGRLSALGGSDLADGSPSALVINPAPLARGNNAELSYDHADYFLEAEISTLAGSVEWNNLRLNFASHDYYIDDVLVRTAYNPEGTGQTIDYLNRMTISGVSYDLGRGLLNNPSWSWSVGGAWRHYLNKFDDTTATADSYDFGTTARFTTRFRNGWASITGAMSWQNFNDSTIAFDERKSLLPQPFRMGVTMQTAFDWTGHERPLVKFLMACTLARNGSSYLGDTEHVGIEAVFFDALALRLGHSTRISGDIDSWGVGVIINRGLLGSFTVHADVGQMDYDNILVTEGETMWGLRVGYVY